MQIGGSSACATASGDGERLAGAFLTKGRRAAGVAGAGLSISAAARLYVETMYRALLAGEPLERAMFRGSAALRERADTSRPSFWAGFEAYEAASPWRP